ncbi:MAG: MATE family efflux transporter, partial [Clostridium sp.]|nr:MATE family efflux transporter [Clostridium sp.]
MTKDMTSGNPAKLIILFSIPLLIGNIFQQFYSMVDTIIVGRYVGVDALAAVGSTGSMFFLINGFVTGITSGFAILVAQKFGAKDEKGLKKAVGSAVILSAFVVIIFTAGSLLSADPLLRLMNTPDNIFNDASTYIKIIYAGIFATLSYNMLSSILRALGDSKTPLYFLILSSVLNIFLDLLFIINFKMGVAGAAYATIISQGVSAALCFFYMLKRYKMLRLSKDDYNVTKDYYITHLKIGIPMALQFSITAIGVMIIQGAINVFGSVVIASYTASSKVQQIVVQPAITLGVTMATFCGQNLGARDFERIRDGVKKGIEISIITSIIAAILLILGGRYSMGLFIENPTEEILNYGQLVFKYSSYFFIPLG